MKAKYIFKIFTIIEHHFSEIEEQILLPPIPSEEQIDSSVMNEVVQLYMMLIFLIVVIQTNLAIPQ